MILLEVPNSTLPCATNLNLSKFDIKFWMTKKKSTLPCATNSSASSSPY